MEVTGSGLVAKPESVVDPRSTTHEAQTGSQDREPAATVDEVAFTEFARINLLMPPRDGVKLAQLQQAVFSGRYGPPAVTIAEALIALAVSRGLKI